MAEENKRKYNLISVNFSAVDPPKFVEKKNKDYISYGVKNDWPDYLYDLYNRSAKHKALIDGKVDFVCGRGFKIEDDANITNEARAQINSFINKANDDESLRQLDYLTTFDGELYGGFYLELIWSNDGERISEVNYMDFRYLRRSVKLDSYYYTEDWAVRKPENNDDWEEIKEFNLDDRSGKAILFVGNTRDVYPLPSYLPAINMIEADYELSVFDLCNIKNQFVPSFLINFSNGVPSPEEADEIERQIEDKFTGSENAGRFIINFADDNSKHAEITPITPSNLDKQYQILEQRIDSTLLVAHKVINPILFGWKEGQGGFSNNADELRVAQDAYQSRYVDARQEAKAELFNNILAVNGLPKVLEVKPLASIKEKLSLADLIPFMTQDEIRAEAGLEPLNNSTSMNATKFGAEREELLNEYFSGCGVSQDDYEILMKVDFQATNINDFRKFDDDTFAVVTGLNSDDLSVLNALNQNPAATNSEIVEATNLTADQVAESLAKLENLGAIEQSEGQRSLTEDGVDTVVEGEGAQLQLMYRYVTRVDAPPLKGESRLFCRTRLTERKLYTRDEIDRLQNGQGLDVFTSRGGWLNNTRTGRNTPFCRHIWQGVIVRRSNG